MAYREKPLLGAAIKARRTELGLTQRQLADTVEAGGVTWAASTAGKIEAGTRDATLLELALLCIALQCSLEELLEYAEADLETPLGVEIPTAAIALALAGEIETAAELSSFLGLVAETANSIAADPDAATIVELTGLEPWAVSAALTILGNDPVTRRGRARRKQWLARDLVEAELEEFRSDNPNASGHALRKARNHAVRRLSDSVREVFSALVSGELEAEALRSGKR